MDPHEAREYYIGCGANGLCSDNIKFKIFAKDKRSGVEYVLEGSQQGEKSRGYLKRGQVAPRNVTTPELNLSVIYKGKPYTITCEDGTKNDFGIFDKHDINPVAAYIDLGRDGYKTLQNQFATTLDWDRDTMAYPPDNLDAVHLTAANGEHGWVFRTDVFHKV